MGDIVNAVADVFGFGPASKQAEATFKDGVLVINLPKLKSVAAQKIAVKPAQ